MEIRPTEIKDLPLVMEIYDYARAFMRATGNTTQWIDGYPSEALIRREIEESHSFACIDEQGEILGTFCFILGTDHRFQVYGLSARRTDSAGRYCRYCRYH